MAVDLTKKQERLKISLQKKKIEKIVMQVATVFDRSGSMDTHYSNGTMQNYLERMVPIGLKFDDNGQIDNWAFTAQSYETGPVTLENLEGFVKREIMSIGAGSTCYAPVLRDINDYYFQTSSVVEEVKPTGFFGKLFGKTEQKVNIIEKLDVDPVYLIFQTDGDNDYSDKGPTLEIIRQLSKKPIYIQFVGIGNDTDFHFIKKLADDFDQVGFIHIPNLQKATDEEIYDLLISDELKNFLTTKHPNNITIG